MCILRLEMGPGGRLLDLDAGDEGAGVHFVRHQADEVAQAKGRFENATEWWGGLVFTLFFVMIAGLWRRTGYAWRTVLTR